MPEDPVPTVIRTLRFKVRREGYPWLEAAAVEVNQVWNWGNSVSARAARPFAGPPRWLSGFDLDKLSAGATKYFEHIGADTIQKVNAEFATRRRQFSKTKLRWRVSRGRRKSLGWIPFKAASLRRRGRALRFCGKTLRVFECERFLGIRQWQDGGFSQDAVGDWWLNLPVAVGIEVTAAPKVAVGIDLGLHRTATTSDGEVLEAGRAYRDLEPKIASAQRRGHKRQAKRLHRAASRCRANALHQFRRQIVNTYQTIVVGDVSSVKLAKTRMAKAVLDSGWGLLRAQLQYKGEDAGRSVRVVSERNTSRTCSACGARTGPAGVNGLRVRQWVCRECRCAHDRDVNAAKNILAARGCPSSVRGNESSPRHAPPSRTPCPRKAGTARAGAAA
jgi:IS605 OrfB family transposase